MTYDEFNSQLVGTWTTLRLADGTLLAGTIASASDNDGKLEFRIEDARFEQVIDERVITEDCASPVLTVPGAHGALIPDVFAGQG